MAGNLINRMLRLHISPKSMGRWSYSTASVSQQSPSTIGNSFLSSLQITSSSCSPKFGQSPATSINVDLPMQNNWRCPIIIENPLNISNMIIDMPKQRIIPLSDNNTDNPLELPTSVIIEKQAARLIVIRRRKMRKHKRKKWRKKMKFFLRKIKQRRELKKEKAFQAELLGQIKEAEVFDAKSYVDSRLQILDNVRIPNKWRGEVLPETMIRQFLKEKHDRLMKKINRPRISLDD